MSIALIDRRSATRRCLIRWFQQGSPDLRVVSATSAADLINLSGSVEDLHLIVFSVGGSSLREPATFGQIVWLRQHMPCVPLVLLMDRNDMDGIVEAMAQGVRGFITTSMALLETGAATQYVGGTFVPARILVRFAEDRQNGSKCGPSEDRKELSESLTPRELEVLALLREGKPNKVIACALGIREGTIKVFVRRILGKLQASNRTELALLARAWSARSLSE